LSAHWACVWHLTSWNVELQPPPIGHTHSLSFFIFQMENNGISSAADERITQLSKLSFNHPSVVLTAPLFFFPRRGKSKRISGKKKLFDHYYSCIIERSTSCVLDQWYLLRSTYQAPGICLPGIIKLSNRYAGPRDEEEYLMLSYVQRNTEQRNNWQTPRVWSGMKEHEQHNSPDHSRWNTRANIRFVPFFYHKPAKNNEARKA